MYRPAFIAAGIVACAAAVFAELGGASLASPDHPAIGYDTRPVNDAIAQLNRKMQDGQVQLKFDGMQGYLRSLLEALDIPVESQMVVFSKTSLQMHLISPQHPRTIYFNDRVAVAWVPREPFVEITADDPKQGVIFYTLDQRPAERPEFVRRDECLVCHESYSTLGVPGMQIRSVFPAPDGRQMRQFGDYTTDHRSRFEERWGGWYVTGKRLPAHHLGNAMVTAPDTPEPPSGNPAMGRLQVELNGASYLSPHSDIVALMVFGHQVQMINLLTRVGWETRFALFDHRDLAARILDDGARELVDYLLFIDEAPLAGSIEGSSGFAEKFTARGPQDRKGRSLRDFDLERRLMRYPCSYMIYTETFDSLPDEAKAAIYKRMWQVLSGQEKDRKYARISLADRQAIVEILRDTKPGLPDYFAMVTR